MPEALVLSLIIFLVVVAVLFINSYRQTQRIEELERKLQEVEEGSAVSVPVEAESAEAVSSEELGRAARFISQVVDAQLKLSRGQVEDIVRQAAEEAGIAAEEAAATDLAQGIALLAHAAPRVAMHARNYGLLAQWRAELGGRAFVCVCGHLAVELEGAGSAPWAQSWREGEPPKQDVRQVLEETGLAHLLSLSEPPLS